MTSKIERETNHERETRQMTKFRTGVAVAALMITAPAMAQSGHRPKCGVDDNGNFKVCRTKAEIDACHRCMAADGWCICTEADRAAARKYFHSRGSQLWTDVLQGRTSK
jgi:hypothetical protein